VLPQVLDGEVVAELRAHARARLASQDSEHFERFRYHGSMLPLDWRDELTAKLVAWPATIRALRDLGFSHPKWLSGYIISKPPRSPALWWHQDWWAWREPESFSPMPPQLFVMYYLRDVQPHDGCLRVIPGSHRRRHPLHDRLPEAHCPDLNDPAAAADAQAPQRGEVAVPARAGDAVIGDVRLLHATYANESARHRTCVTLWYLPTYDALSESLQAYVVDHPFLPPKGWWDDPAEELRAPLRSMLPTYRGHAEPARYERTPPARFTTV
jgi:ectoine hydroxylase-related dioxygenase (phytanoyl-CoA dioxygenase family)